MVPDGADEKIVDMVPDGADEKIVDMVPDGADEKIETPGDFLRSCVS